MFLLKDTLNIRMYPPYLKAVSSTRKLRTRRIAVPGNHLPCSYQNIFRMMLLRSLHWRRRVLLHSKRVRNEKLSGISKKCHLINFFRNTRIHKKKAFHFHIPKWYYTHAKFINTSIFIEKWNFPTWSCIYKL